MSKRKKSAYIALGVGILLLGPLFIGLFWSNPFEGNTAAAQTTRPVIGTVECYSGEERVLQESFTREPQTGVQNTALFIELAGNEKMILTADCVVRYQYQR